MPGGAGCLKMTPKLVVSAIILQDGKILLVKRNKFPEKNKWAMPGGLGAFKDFPDPKEAVEEEVKFDLNTEFLLEKFFDYSFYVGEEGPTVTLHFIGKIKGNLKLNPNETSEYKFFSKQEILNMPKEDFAFSHKEVLERYFEKC